ncbi:hypothetical protein GUI43_03274 [Micromonospora noduli]|nr:hypothetical protein GUI43_03274 [Micromonospora noduli]
MQHPGAARMLGPVASLQVEGDVGLVVDDRVLVVDPWIEGRAVAAEIAAEVLHRGVLGPGEVGLRDGDVVGFRPLDSGGLEPGRVDHSHRIVAAVPEQVAPVGEAARVAARPPAQPRHVVPGPGVAEAGLVVHLVPAEAVPLQAEVGARPAVPVRGSAVRVVLLVGDEHPGRVGLQRGRAEVVGELVTDQRNAERVGRIEAADVDGLDVHLGDRAGVVGDRGGPPFVLEGAGDPVAPPEHGDRAQEDPFKLDAARPVHDFAQPLTARGVDEPGFATAAEVDPAELVVDVPLQGRQVRHDGQVADGVVRVQGRVGAGVGVAGDARGGQPVRGVGRVVLVRVPVVPGPAGTYAGLRPEPVPEHCEVAQRVVLVLLGVGTYRAGIGEAPGRRHVGLVTDRVVGRPGQLPPARPDQLVERVVRVVAGGRHRRVAEEGGRARLGHPGEVAHRVVRVAQVAHPGGEQTFQPERRRVVEVLGDQPVAVPGEPPPTQRVVVLLGQELHLRALAAQPRGEPAQHAALEVGRS